MYKSIADIFDDLYPHDVFLDKVQALSKKIAKSISNDSHGEATIVDLCCGTGRGLSIWKGMDKTKIIGIDIDENLLQKAEQNYPTATFYLRDLNYFNPDDDQISNVRVVTIFGVSIMHFDELQRGKLFSKISSMLCKGGIFVFDILPTSRLEKCNQRFINIKKHFSRDGKETIILYDEEKIEEHFRHTHIRLESDGMGENIAWESFPFYNINYLTLQKELLETGFKVIEIVSTDYDETEFIFAIKTE